jgi:Tol biopolymer transport system component
VVLYELLTGERLFKGSDTADTLAQVLTKQPPLERAPLQVRSLLGACLQKDPRQRLRDIGDAKRLLTEETLPAPSRSRVGWATAVLVAVAVLVFGILYVRKPPEDPRVIKLSILPPDNAAFEPELPAVSPDGEHVAFVAVATGQIQIWVRELNSLASRALPGTEGGVRPFWSPNSRYIGFFAAGKLKKIAAAGGPILTLADSPHSYFGAWSKDDVILYTPDNAIFQVSANGGTPSQVTDFNAKTETFHAVDSFLPDGRHFIYTIVGTGNTFIGDLKSNVRQQLAVGGSGFSPLVVYASPGFLLFGRDRTLMAQPFEAGQERISGDAMPVAEPVAQPTNAPTFFSVSHNGVLVYYPSPAARQLTWFDQSGKPAGVLGPPGAIRRVAISPDGSVVAYENRDATPTSIWLHDTAHGNDVAFERNAQWPIWSPDGGSIAFRRGMQLYKKGTNGAPEAQELVVDGREKLPDDFSRDGRYFIYDTRLDPKTGDDIWVRPLFEDRKPFPYLHGEANEKDAKLSPDTHWLAYVSDETKRDQVYVIAFPNLERPTRVSTSGGDRPVWSRDGKELYFIAANGKMMVAAIKPGSRFDYDEPKPLLDARIAPFANYDVDKDGRFLIPVPPAEGIGPAMHVVVNWPAELKK